MKKTTKCYVCTLDIWERERDSILAKAEGVVHVSRGTVSIGKVSLDAVRVISVVDAEANLKT